jgi:hypothetical protein
MDLAVVVMVRLIADQERIWSFPSRLAQGRVGSSRLDARRWERFDRDPTAALRSPNHRLRLSLPSGISEL